MYPFEIKKSANPNKEMLKNFDILNNIIYNTFVKNAENVNFCKITLYNFILIKYNDTINFLIKG